MEVTVFISSQNVGQMYFLIDGTSGSRNKISLKFKKCAISNKSIQNGGPGRCRKSQRNTKKTPPPTAGERTPRHRSILEIVVRCHPPRKTSQLTAELEESPKR